MNEKELKEMIALLESAGCRPQLCDKPIPLSGNAVMCGLPTEPGDEYFSEYIMLPKSVVGMHPEVFIPAEGDSMRDAGRTPHEEQAARSAQVDRRRGGRADHQDRRASAARPPVVCRIQGHG